MTLEIIFIALGIIWVASKFIKEPKKIDEMKKLLMWNSVIRG